MLKKDRRKLRLKNLDGESWRLIAARAGFPILVEYARKCSEITYSKWDEEIVQRGLGHHVHLTQYGKPAGAIGDACKEYSSKLHIKVPPINLLVVSKKNRIPGSGVEAYANDFCKSFLNSPKRFETLTLPQKRSIVDRAQEEIFAFEGWSDVLHAFGLAETVAFRSKMPDKRLRRPDSREWHTGPESQEHKDLKSRIVADPSLVGLKRGATGCQEYGLSSGDEVDVFFKALWTAVEVKTSSANVDELLRGVFQCVKYKSVLRAMQMWERLVPMAQCVLALGGPIPREVRDCAKMLEIPYYENLER